MLVARYKFKKNLKDSIGHSLKYQEVSMFGPEFLPDGKFTVVGPGAYNRKWYAEVTMRAGRIDKVT